jgi:hypothetical protein
MDFWLKHHLVLVEVYIQALCVCVCERERDREGLNIINDKDINLRNGK